MNASWYGLMYCMNAYAYVQLCVCEAPYLLPRLWRHMRSNNMHCHATTCGRQHARPSMRARTSVHLLTTGGYETSLLAWDFAPAPPSLARQARRLFEAGPSWRASSDTADEAPGASGAGARAATPLPLAAARAAVASPTELAGHSPGIRPSCKSASDGTIPEFQCSTTVAHKSL